MQQNQFAAEIILLDRWDDMGHSSDYEIDFAGKSNQSENCAGTFKMM